MAKLGLIAALTFLVGLLTVAAYGSPADAAEPCKRKEFKTEMVKQACEKGGQKAAKDAMKAFMKDKKIKSCNLCHDKLAPAYTLKPEGYDLFKKHGGVMLPAK